MRLAILSALLHLGLLLLLALRLAAPRQDASPPPADFAMVFESGATKPSTAPKPSGNAPPAPQSRTSSPASPPPAGTSAPAATPTQAAPREAVPPPPPARPQPTHPAQPRPAPRTPVQVAPASPAPASPPTEAPPPRPALPPLHPPRPAATPPRTRTRQPSATAGAGRFPAPIMRSFFIPSTASGSAHPYSRAFASGDQAVLHVRSSDKSFDLKGADQLGSAWINAFMAWVDEHKHYPEQAAANGEDGDTTVQFTVDRFGHVKEVRLYERSGSVWLDMGLTGMFRDARLPPFPYGTAQDDLQMLFTMHYIIDR